MIKPKLYDYKKPETTDDYPEGTYFKAGHLVSTNASYRTHRPVLDSDACVNCLACYISCPDGTIFKTDKKVDFDYDFCKGCGICARVCTKKAIRMIKE